MSDLRTRLERIGDRVRPAPDAFAQLERARRRRERNRRVAAGVVALLVTVAGSLAAFSAFRGGEPKVAGGGEDAFFALWPESTLEAAQAAQAEVANGDPELQWRLDAEATAIEFVADALGWPEDPEALAVSSTTSPDGVTTVDLGVPPAPCPSPPVAGCEGHDVILRLRRLVAAGGIWSVVSAESPVFNVPLHPGEEVELGTEIAVAAGFEDGTEVAVGIAGTGPCSGFREQTAVVQDLQVVVPVRGVQAGCLGYVYALTPPTPTGQVELGRIMFVYGQPKPALEYTITAITAMPVSFVDASAEPAAEARIGCDGANPLVETPVVATQPDGVHVAVSNPTDQTISFSIGTDVSMPDAAASELEPGTQSLLLTTPPGRMSFSCAPPPEPDHAGVAGLGSFDVVDPDGNYLPAELECDEGSAYGTGPAYPVGTTGERGDPLEVTQRHLTGLEPDDVVELAGYTGSASPMIRIVRGGAVVGRVTLADDGSGGWLLSSVEGCGGTSFGLSQEVTSGVFPACPDLAGALSPGPDADAEARAVAERFVAARRAGDREAAVTAIDPSTGDVLSETGTFGSGDEVVVLASGPGNEDGLVVQGCGQEVADRTWVVVVDDGSDSASLDFNVYLVRRDDGWKVWGWY